MFLVIFFVKLLLAYLSLVKLHPLKIGILLYSIAERRHPLLRHLGFIPFLPCDNGKLLRNIKFSLCFPIILVLITTSLTYAANDNCHNYTSKPPVTMLLNEPNYLDKCLTDLSNELVINIHNFLEYLELFELDDGENDSIKKSTFFNKRHHQEYYDLYCVLSLRYYKGQSFTGFVRYMIYNEPARVISRPLLEAMRKLCNDYKDRPGITIGNMLTEVAKQKHTDENIKAFLRYKANDIETQHKALYSDDNTSTNKYSANANSSTDSSMNNKSWSSWLRRCSQKSISCAKNIVKNVSRLAPKEMYTAPYFSALMMPLAGADNNNFVCDNGRKVDMSKTCNNKNDCGDYSDEHILLCCKDQIFDATTRRCDHKYMAYQRLFICDDNKQTIRINSMCDGSYNCADKSEEKASSCCYGGIQGRNSSTGICEEKDSESSTLFVCEDGYTTHIGNKCNGKMECADNSDEKVSYCCKDGIKGINKITQLCRHYYSSDKQLFVCDNKYTIDTKNLCDNKHDCTDGNDERLNGTNPTCFDCSGDNKKIILGKLICDGNNDCPNGNDERLNGTNPTCFDCGGDNRKLILGKFLCDGNNDCPDGNDERLNGTNPTCFDCGGNNRKLILGRLLCDGHNDCPDDSDERLNGTNPTCFDCGGDNKKIILGKLIYDGNNDCPNGNDERRNVTNPTYFDCGGDNRKLILGKFLCDGNNDCPNDSDERLNGTNPTCFDCGGNNRKLILGNLLCDGNNDCPNDSDERLNGTNPTCFDCGGNNRKLILGNLLCDGNNDCPNDSDERLNGTNPTCFDCGGNNRTLILGKSLCDGINDCPDDSDERLNGTNPTCFDCGENNRTLISSKLLCDGENNCLDGSDEYWNCTSTSPIPTLNTDTNLTSTFTTAGLVIAGVITCTTYIVMLVKNRETKRLKGTRAWLLSPITKPVNYLLRYCGYRQANTESDE